MNSIDTKNTEISFSSNGVRLTFKQWIFAAIICITTIIALPSAWKLVEKFEPGDDYRQPYQLGSDYWFYERYSKVACMEYETVLLGDSVIWGHYVPKDKTLSHYLNELTSENKFANLGVDGMHPAALEGLVRYYGKAIQNKNVILHLNLLWLSSPKHDLQTEKEFRFNHPKLVSQFKTKIPCYTAPRLSRFVIALERPFSFPAWTSHLNISYFNNTNMPTWTMNNPYKNPLDNFSRNLPDEDTYQKIEESESSENKPAGGDFQWVQAETSLQWKFFRNTLEILQKRKNEILVLIGPFNEHMLSGESLDNYLKLKDEIEKWLKQNNISYYSPQTLPDEQYNDASHPTAEGYNTLAKELIESKKLVSTR
ncbi:MAG: hypothetical protein JXA96_05490 [Sedimentisphaerales bacterium]|nr:hypothetical protein [Sedimentisphaerales bacterium]